MLITIRPGPVLMVWRNGQLTAEVPLTADAVLYLISALIFHFPRSPK